MRPVTAFASVACLTFRMVIITKVSLSKSMSRPQKKAREAMNPKTI